MISKEHLLDLIEDYASAKTTGRTVLIQGAIMRLNQAVELMFTPTTGEGNQDIKDADPT